MGEFALSVSNISNGPTIVMQVELQSLTEGNRRKGEESS
jgi:hypothetical protein